MSIEEFNKLTNGIPDYNLLASNVDSFDKLSVQLESFGKEAQRLYNNIEKIQTSSMSDAQKASLISAIDPEYKVVKDKIQALLQIQQRYTMYLTDLREYLEIDVSKASNKEEAKDRRKKLREKLEETYKFIPANLKKELAAKAKELEASYKKAAPTEAPKIAPSGPRDFKTAYTALEINFNNALGYKTLDEMGIRNLRNTEKKYNELNEKVKELLADFKANSKGLTAEEKADLEKKIPELQAKIEQRIQETRMVREAKLAQKVEIKNQISVAKQNIQDIEKEIRDLQHEIQDDFVNGVDRNVIQKKYDLITFKTNEIRHYEELIRQLEEDLKVIEKGGKLETREPILPLEDERKKGTPAPKVDPPKVDPPKKDAPKPEPTKPDPTPKPGTPTPEDRKKGDKPVVREDRSKTLDELVAEGKLPKYLKREELVLICAALNINAEAKDALLNPEQIQRLAEDHEIQMAMLNQKIFDRNQTKIAQYDKLISQYESILKDKLNTRNFTPEYIAKVQTLLGKCKEERQNYINKNEKMKLQTHDAILEEYDGRAMGVNDKLREKYQQLDELRKQKDNYKSKFKQNRLEARIKRVQKRIDRLKGKKATMASKQQQIVNENSQKYIDRVTEKLQRFMERQVRIEQSIDRINDLGNRIDKNLEEIDSLEEDIKNERNFFERVGMRIEDGRLKRQTGRLENELDRENRAGRRM